jgi:hypothetical protein
MRHVFRRGAAPGSDGPSTFWFADPCVAGRRSVHPLEVHAHALSRALFEVAEQDIEVKSGGGWELAGDWLRIAAGVERTDVNTAAHDESVMFCRGAWEYETDRSAVVSRFATELSRFLFTWGAVESVIAAIRPPRPASCSGSTSAACLYLLNSGEDGLLHYDCCVRQLKALSLNTSLVRDPEKMFRTTETRGVPGVGLYVAGALRNRIAHGAPRIPDAIASSGPDTSHAELVRTATRAILYSIQMLLAARLRGTGAILHDPELADDGDACFVVRHLHLQDWGHPYETAAG